MYQKRVSKVDQFHAKPNTSNRLSHKSKRVKSKRDKKVKKEQPREGESKRKKEAKEEKKKQQRQEEEGLKILPITVRLRRKF